MNKELITRVSLEEWAKMKGQTDWAKIDGMTPEEIEQNALNDPDNQPLPDEFWDEAEVIVPSSSFKMPTYAIETAPTDND